MSRRLGEVCRAQEDNLCLSDSARVCVCVRACASDLPGRPKAPTLVPQQSSRRPSTDVVVISHVLCIQEQACQTRLVFGPSSRSRYVHPTPNCAHKCPPQTMLAPSLFISSLSRKNLHNPHKTPIDTTSVGSKPQHLLASSSSADSPRAMRSARARATSSRLLGTCLLLSFVGSGLPTLAAKTATL